MPECRRSPRLVGQPLRSHAFFRRYLPFGGIWPHNCSSIDLNCVKIIYCIAFRCMPPLSALVYCGREPYGANPSYAGISRNTRFVDPITASMEAHTAKRKTRNRTKKVPTEQNYASVIASRFITIIFSTCACFLSLLLLLNPTQQQRLRHCSRPSRGHTATKNMIA